MAFIPAYILILLVTILIDYTAGIYIENTRGNIRRYLLVLSIFSTCAVLFVFKYFDFFTTNFVGIAGLLGWHVAKPAVNIILPIGLSFHTFQSLSYVIEVYFSRQKAERNFGTYALYVMFFPQLVAGPIERPQNLLHQFYEVHSFDYSRVCSGLKRIAWGLFKKIVIADRLALYVNDVYASPRDFNGPQLSIATVFFAYQIYCDFSGYSDIAIGSARILGFRLMENFQTPYYSASVGEFWHRWHISLSTWFRDYVYIPLSGSRAPKHRWYLNLLLTFGLSGLWHGANWTYVLWGILNGIYMVVGNITLGLRQRVFERLGLPATSPARHAIRVFSTVGLTLLAWILFRSKSLGDAGYIVTHLFGGWGLSAVVKTQQFQLRYFPCAIAGIITLEAIQLLQPRISFTATISRLPTALRWVGYVSFTFIILLFGVYRHTQFIYFQF
jgi:D-alanyl-lipoteichoic acid acyltransferase DltB (MBOAT superfamily)